MESEIESNPSGCDGCALPPSRRAFLQHAAAAAGAAMLGLGIPAPAVDGLTLSRLRPAGRRGATVSYPIPAEDGAQIDRDNQVILVRWQGSVYAFNLSCPHQNTALRWHPSESQFQCPKHHSKYRPDGAFVSGRATRGMDRLGIRKSGKQVVVDVDQFFKETDDRKGWQAAVVTV